MTTRNAELVKKARKDALDALKLTEKVRKVLRRVLRHEGFFEKEQ